MAPDAFWRHVTLLSTYDGSGGSKKWRCNYCGLEKSGSVTRVKDHLACVPNKDIGPCASVPVDVKASLDIWRRKRLGLELHEEESSQHVGVDDDVVESSQAQPGTSKRSASGSVSGPSAKRTPLPSSSAPKGSLQSASIHAGFQKQCMLDATRELTRLFIRCAIPFNVATTQQWKKTMRAISRIGCEWEGPSANALRTGELKREKACIETQLEPLKETWSKYGCTVLCDGWSDIRKRNVYNVLVSSCKGTMFIKAIDASAAGLTITGAFIWSHLRQVIMDIGVQNVVQVITDNGSNCVAMGHMLEDEFPSITWTPCASHCLDLLIEDVGKIFWVDNIFKIARSMVRFVKKRPKVTSMFRANSTLELLKPSATRFAYMFIVLERLIRVRPNLIRTIACPEWLSWNEKESPKAIAFRRHILDESWWLEAEALVKTLTPIYTVLRITDMEGSTLGLLYEYMDKIGEALLRNGYLPQDKVDEIRAVWNTRWDWFQKPIHVVVHALHPLWRSEGHYTYNELEEGFMEYMRWITSGDLDMMRRIEDDLLAFRDHSLHFGPAIAKHRET